MRTDATVLVFVLAVLLLDGASALAMPPVGLRLEATVGAAWRASIDENDRNSGFEAGAACL